MLKIVHDVPVRRIRMVCDEQGYQAVEDATRAFRAAGNDPGMLDVSPVPDGHPSLEGATHGLRWMVAMTIPESHADNLLRDMARRANQGAAPSTAGGDVRYRESISDWRIEDGAGDEDLTDAHRAPGEMTVIRTAYGLMIEARAPGAEAAHGLALEFDAGAVKFFAYRGGVDEIQATGRIDANTVTLQQDQDVITGDRHTI